MYRYFAIQPDESTDASNCAFFFVSCIVWEKKISTKNFYVALNQDVPPGQKYFDFLTNTLVRKRLSGETVLECAQMKQQTWLVIPPRCISKNKRSGEVERKNIVDSLNNASGASAAYWFEKTYYSK